MASVKYCTLIILVFCLLFPSCADRATDGADAPGEISERVAAALDTERFVRADEDFIRTNFGNEGLKEGAVFFERDGIGEWGVFELEDRAAALAFQENVRQYLQIEREAVESLAQLYPAEELDARLSLYENAVVDSQNVTVYYLLLSHAEQGQILAALGFS